MLILGAVILLGLAVSDVVAQSRSHVRRTVSAKKGGFCAAGDPTEEHRALSRALAAKEKNLLGGAANGTAEVNVDTYFHVVTSALDEGRGLVSDDMLQRQFAVLNDDFKSSNIRFTLAGVTRTAHQIWSADGDEIAMKKSLRQGDYSTLNIYFLDQLDALGYCYFPGKIDPQSDAFVRDGCSVLSQTLPGGTQDGFNRGRTTIHEVGHWFGLYHTFEGGCEGEGDEIDDTPAEASPANGCPTGRDSCPNKPGLDPISNFMDYSADECVNSFSSGQAARMHSFWDQFRHKATIGFGFNATAVNGTTFSDTTFNGTTFNGTTFNRMRMR